MKTIQPTNQITLTEDTSFEPGIYFLPDGIVIAENGITLDGNGAQIIGNGRSGIGIKLKGQQNITLKNLQISGFTQGIQAVDCQSLTIKNCRIRECAGKVTPRLPGPLWSAQTTIPSGIVLAGVSKSQVLNNDLQAQSNGFAAFSCRELHVRGNNSSHNLGFGFLLNDTSDSSFQDNLANHCESGLVSPQPQGKLKPEGSAGFLLVNGSKKNIFRANKARSCIVGFQLVGLAQGECIPCSGNKFEANDASHCIFSGFVDHHNEDNHYFENEVNYVGAGFSLKFVSGIILESNTIIGNHKAGIGAENSIHCSAVHNTLQDNRFGILLWSSPDPKALSLHPKNITSQFWDIRNNTFLRNHTGIRIAADQVAGLTPLNHGLTGQTPKPHDHEIQQNVISDNRIGIQTYEAERTIIKDNHFELNLLGDIKS